MGHLRAGSTEVGLRRFPVVDRREYLVGLVRAQSHFRVCKADERPQQIGRLGQGLPGRHDLSGNPVLKHDLDFHRAPQHLAALAVKTRLPRELQQLPLQVRAALHQTLDRCHTPLPYIDSGGLDGIGESLTALCANLIREVSGSAPV